MDEPIPEKALKSRYVTVEDLVIPDRVRLIADEPGRMTNSTNFSFFTAYARRAFRKNFYFLSVKIFDKRNDPRAMDRIAAAQKDVLTVIEALSKKHGQWLHLENTLVEKQFTNIVEICPECTRLRQTFMKLDQFLVVPYLSKIAGVLSQPELDKIMDEVDRLLKELISSVSIKEGAVGQTL